MLTTLDGISIFFSDIQPLNAELPMLTTLDGISIFFSDVQPLNADSPISFILPSKFTVSRYLQPENHPLPTLSMLCGNVMLANAVLLNAYSPISVNDCGKIISFSPMQPEKALSPILVTLLSFTSVSALQLSKTEFGTETKVLQVALVSETQFLKTQDCILLTLWDTSIVFKFSQ